MLTRLGAFLAAALFVVPAFAQNGRSAVSINGNDANPCTTAAPCRSFGAAMAVTNNFGEIIAVDSAGYGPFTIDRAVTVSGAPGVHAAISVTSGAGITVLTGGGSNWVVIRNLVLVGSGGSSGISTQQSTLVRIIGCLIRGFTTAGIDSGSTIIVDRTSIMDNVSGAGVRFANLQGSGTSHAALTHSTIQGNATGIAVLELAAAAVSDTIVTDNTIGVSTTSTTNSTTAEVTLEQCTIAHNGVDGIQASATGTGNLARVQLSNDVIAYNGQGVDKGTNATVFSFGNNRFVGNGTDGGPFTPAASK